MSKDFYEVLGISKDADQSAIKTAYRKLAMKYHPDRNNGSKEAEAKFKNINEAYSILSDEGKRRSYDRYGSVEGFQGAGFSTEFDIGDIISEMFGGGGGSGFGFGGGQGGGRRAKRTGRQDGEDIQKLLTIDLETSINGGKETLKYERYVLCGKCDGEGGDGKKQCGECHGSGYVTYRHQTVFSVIEQSAVCNKCQGTGESVEHVCNECHGNKRVKETKELDIDIPEGIDDGMMIKIEGEGNDGVNDGNAGSLYIKFVVKPEDRGLKRKGSDLYFEVEIDIVEAVLGTEKEINIPILGKRKIQVEPGTQLDAVIRLSGEGVKYIDRDRKGDLYIPLVIKVPKKLSKKTRELYQEIAKENKLNVLNKKGIMDKLFGE